MITKNANQRGYLSSESINKTIDNILSYKTARSDEVYLVSIHIRPSLYTIVRFDSEAERQESKEDYDSDMWGDYDDSDMWENTKYQLIYARAKEKLENGYGWEFIERLPTDYDGQVVTAEQYDSFDEAAADLLLLKRDDLLMAKNVDEDTYQNLDNKYQELTGKSFSEAEADSREGHKKRLEEKMREAKTPQTCTCTCMVCDYAKEGPSEKHKDYPHNQFNHCYGKIGFSEAPVKPTGKCFDSIHNHPNIDEFNKEKDKKDMIIWDRLWDRFLD